MFVEKKYINFIKNNGYIPKYFNPYNESEIKDIAPTLSTQCGSTTSSATVLILEGYMSDVKNPLKNKTPYGWHFEQNVYDMNGITRSVKAGSGSGNIPKVILNDNEPYTIIGSTQKHAAISKNGIVPTLTSAMGRGGGHVPMHNYNIRIRKLTPKECWRLMGFKDDSFEKAEKVNSNTQLYKQAGNSICVSVLEKILKNLLKDTEYYDKNNNSNE